MQRHKSLLTFASLVLCATLVGQAEVKTVVNHNSGDKATADFKFKDVPTPAKENAAAKTTITIVDGEKDGACRDAAELNTGKLPTEEDSPDDNFFFNAGTDGGILSIDLGAVKPVEQVNTYSWHANTRGPQVYKLYAADGTEKGFNASPKKGTDPTTVGWKLVATVDTRPKDGEPGGQYGVSTTDSTGKLGDYRYLLMDCSKTEGDDDFGNTFFSKIDVITKK